MNPLANDVMKEAVNKAIKEMYRAATPSENFEDIDPDAYEQDAYMLYFIPEEVEDEILSNITLPFEKWASDKVRVTAKLGRAPCNNLQKVNEAREREGLSHIRKEDLNYREEVVEKVTSDEPSR